MSRLDGLVDRENLSVLADLRWLRGLALPGSSVVGPPRWITSVLSRLIRARIGAHMSVAGGVSKAVDRAVVHGCEALQIFAKNANQWRARPLDADEVRRFRRRIEETGITPAVSHASYLINLATTDPALRAQSIDAWSTSSIARTRSACSASSFILARARPGRRTTRCGSSPTAIRDAFTARPRRKTMVILEHTAGQGRTVGHRFEHLAAILESPRRLAARRRLPRHVPSRRVRLRHRERSRAIGTPSPRSNGSSASTACACFTRNDSKRPCGSRVDRHEHIGQGCLGLAPFRRILHDRRFAGLPMLIETEKSAAASHPTRIVADPLDRRNLDTLRRLRTSAAVAERRPGG